MTDIAASCEGIMDSGVLQFMAKLFAWITWISYLLSQSPSLYPQGCTNGCSVQFSSVQFILFAFINYSYTNYNNNHAFGKQSRKSAGRL